MRALETGIRMYHMPVLLSLVEVIVYHSGRPGGMQSFLKLFVSFIKTGYVHTFAGIAIFRLCIWEVVIRSEVGIFYTLQYTVRIQYTFNKQCAFGIFSTF